MNQHVMNKNIFHHPCLQGTFVVLQICWLNTHDNYNYIISHTKYKRPCNMLCCLQYLRQTLKKHIHTFKWKHLQILKKMKYKWPLLLKANLKAVIIPLVYFTNSCGYLLHCRCISPENLIEKVNRTQQE